MRILVSNDDGVDAAGIRMLAAVLREAGHEVTVVAPDRDRSGASNSLTLDLPIRLKRIDHYTVSVAGTPTDCVHLALTGLLEFEPDIVVSGINNAANLGDDVIYSGTVSAAMEGRFLGLPAVAVSLVSRNHDPKHFETAARAAVEIVARLKADPLPADTILNVNVPDLPWSEVKGFEVTRLGNRHRAEGCIAQKDPRGNEVYWIGPAGREQDSGPGTDFTRCAPATSRSPRSRSTSPATRRWRRSPAGSAASAPRWTSRHEPTPAIAAGSRRYRHDLAARA